MWSLILQAIPYNLALADNTRVANALIGAGGQILNDVKQGMMDNMRMMQQYQQAESLLQPLQPKFTPSEKFPMCKVPTVLADRPVGVCQNPVPGEEYLNQRLIDLSEDYRRFYAEGKELGQNTKYPDGLQCVEDQKKRLLSQMDDKINEISQISEQIQRATLEQKKMFDEMKKSMEHTNAELEGGGNLPGDKSKSWTGEFGNNDCKHVLGDAMLSANPQKGLRAIAGAMTDASNGGKSLQDYAADMPGEMAKMENNLTGQIKSITDDIKRVGIEDWIKNPTNGQANAEGQTKFKEIDKAIANQQQVFSAEMKRIGKNLSYFTKNGVDLPELDHNFSENFANFKSGAKQFIHDNFINNCISGPGVMRETKIQQQQERGGSDHKRYEDQLKIIMNTPVQEMNLKAKMERIRALDQEYKITLKTKSDVGLDTFTNTETKMKEAIALCEKRFTSQKSNPSKVGSKSNSDEADKALSSLGDLEALNRNFTTNIAKAIRTKMDECGAGQEAGVVGKCDSSKMNSSDPNFCMKTAPLCAQHVLNCVGTAKELIKKREDHLKSDEAKYNKAMTELTSRQQALVDRVKMLAIADAAMIKASFKESSFEINESLFIIPAEQAKVAELGNVSLIGGGKLDSLDQVAKNMKGVKEMLKAQKENVDKEVEKYLTLQKEGIARNEAFWKETGDKCRAMLNQINQNAAQAFKEQKDAADKLQNEVGAFCMKYAGLAAADNPAAGCDGDNSPSTLYTDASKIAAHINPDVINNILKYKNACARANNESKFNASATTSENPINNYCSSNTSNETLADSLLSDMTGMLPPGILPSSLQAYVRSPNPSATLMDNDGNDFLKSPLGRQIQQIRMIAQEGKNGATSFNMPDTKLISGELLEAAKKELEVLKGTTTPPPPLTPADRKIIQEKEAAENNLKKAITQLGAKSDSLCQAMKQQIILTAISSCAEKNYSPGCIETEKANAQKNSSGIMGQLNGIAANAAKMGKANDNGAFSRMGESARIPCPNLSNGDRLYNSLMEGLRSKPPAPQNGNQVQK